MTLGVNVGVQPVAGSQYQMTPDQPSLAANQFSKDTFGGGSDVSNGYAKECVAAMIMARDSDVRGIG